MRVLLLVSALVLFSGCASRVTKSEPVTIAAAQNHEPLPRDRRAADAVAQERLLKTHFFDEGRGMHLAPGYLRLYDAASWTGLTRPLVHDRWGFNVVDGKVIGLQDVRYKDMTVGVAGCAACHSGKAAGRFYPGLGNKNFDVTQLGHDLANSQRLYAGLTFAKNEKREVEQSAIRFAETIGNRKVGNLTQGMVPVSFIHAWFYQQDPEGGRPPTRGAVKVPALWGYSAKRPVGLFSDGFGVGDPPGWAVAVELAAGQRPETVRRYLPAIESAEEALAALLPAAYPFAMDRRLAGLGRKVYVQNCRECHGDYSRDASGLPKLRSPKWYPLEEVNTDSDRVDLNTPYFQQLVTASPLSDLIKVNPSQRRGYFAPRLEGIWARFPYLHNGSVPNLWALLAPPAQRPVVFSLKAAGERKRFDEKRLGLTLPKAGEISALLRRGGGGQRNIYDTRRIGHSNAGHDFGTGLLEEEKSALIEYLKTL